MKKAIIVEDELIIAKTYQMFLEREGIASVVYRRAEDLMNSEDFPANDISFYILDVQLAGKMTGIELAFQIRKSSNTPIIITTGNSSFKVLPESKEINHCSVLIKPVANNQLFDVIKSLLLNSPLG